MWIMPSLSIIWKLAPARAPALALARAENPSWLREWVRILRTCCMFSQYYFNSEPTVKEKPSQTMWDTGVNTVRYTFIYLCEVRVQGSPQGIVAKNSPSPTHCAWKICSSRRMTECIITMMECMTEWKATGGKHSRGTDRKKQCVKQSFCFEESTFIQSAQCRWTSSCTVGEKLSALTSVSSLSSSHIRGNQLKHTHNQTG